MVAENYLLSVIPTLFSYHPIVLQYITDEILRLINSLSIICHPHLPLSIINLSLLIVFALAICLNSSTRPFPIRKPVLAYLLPKARVISFITTTEGPIYSFIGTALRHVI